MLDWLFEFSSRKTATSRIPGLILESKERKIFGFMVWHAHVIEIITVVRLAVLGLIITVENFQ